MDTEGSVTHPSLDWGSRRVPLEPGQARRVSFRPHAESFAFAGIDRRIALSPVDSW